MFIGRGSVNKTEGPEGLDGGPNASEVQVRGRGAGGPEVTEGG